MSDLKVILFEDPLPLQLLLGLVSAVGVILLIRRRTRTAILLTACPIALIVALGFTAAWVTTETERLAAALDAFIVAVRDGDMAAAGALVDESYADGRYAKAEVLTKIEQTRRSVGLTDLRITSVEMNLTGSDAVVAFRAVIGVSSPAAIYDTVPTRWRLWWIRRPDGWRVTSSRLDDPRGLPGAPTGP